MILDIVFEETNAEFSADFEEIHEVSDGGYDKGFTEGEAAGYEKGNADGYAKGQADGYETGYDEGYAEAVVSAFPDGDEVKY